MKVEHTLMNDSQTKQLVWYGHLQRMEDDRLPKRVSWIEGAQQEMERCDLPRDLWSNRGEWRLEIRRRRRTL